MRKRISNVKLCSCKNNNITQTRQGRLDDENHRMNTILNRAERIVSLNKKKEAAGKALDWILSRNGRELNLS